MGQLAPPRVAAATLAAVGVLGVAYLARTDGGWWALAMFGALGWLAMRQG